MTADDDTSARRRWLLFGAFVPIAVAIDQVTKHLADMTLAARGFGVMPVIDGFFMLRYSRNRGAFFSIGEGMPDAVRVLFFATATVVALGFIVWVYRRADSRQRLLRWGLLLLAAGAVGNLIDRVQNGAVIDFLHLHYADHFHWATFNVADIYITIGLVFLVIDAIRGPIGDEGMLKSPPEGDNTIGTT